VFNDFCKPAAGSLIKKLFHAVQTEQFFGIFKNSAFNIHVEISFHSDSVQCHCKYVATLIMKGDYSTLRNTWFGLIGIKWHLKHNEAQLNF